MAQQSIGLFGIKVAPGEEKELQVYGDIRITNIALGENVKDGARTVVRVHHRSVPFSDDEFDSSDDEEVDDDKENIALKKDDADEVEEQTYVICSLYREHKEQVTVDLHFSAEDEIRFSVSGKNSVEILGSFLSPGRFDEDPDSDELDDDYDSEDDFDELNGYDALEGDDDSDEDGDEDDRIVELMDEDKAEEDDEEKEKARAAANAFVAAAATEALDKATAKAATKKRTAEAAGIPDDENTANRKKQGNGDVEKLSKNQRKKLAKKEAEASAEAIVAKEDEKAKGENNAAAPKAKAQSTKQTLPSGVEITDMKVGSGRAAKSGDRLGMRYVGRLASGKQFDSNTKGKPFTFKLGKGEVIQGWDDGLKGMKVGGERRLRIPPKLGYGSRGAPPDIPGNATLVFDVKLVEIK